MFNRFKKIFIKKNKVLPHPIRENPNASEIIHEILIKLADNMYKYYDNVSIRKYFNDLEYSSKLLFFINIMKTNTNKERLSDIIKKIKITKIDRKKCKEADKFTQFINLNGRNQLIVQSGITYSCLFNKIQENIKNNAIMYSDLNVASYYEIDISKIISTQTPEGTYLFHICILFSNEFIYLIEENKDLEYTRALFDNTIDGSKYYYFKILLLLFILFIEKMGQFTNCALAGGALNKSYQIYISSKDKYFIVYNKKKIYLNKNNTYKEGNCLYLKINNNLKIKLKI